MNIDQICRHVAKELNEPFDDVKQIVMHQFQFIVDVMKDTDDTTDVLINKLFRFTLKKRFKENKQSSYSPYEKDNKH